MAYIYKSQQVLTHFTSHIKMLSWDISP